MFIENIFDRLSIDDPAHRLVNLVHHFMNPDKVFSRRGSSLDQNQ